MKSSENMIGELYHKRGIMSKHWSVFILLFIKISPTSFVTDLTVHIFLLV